MRVSAVEGFAAKTSRFVTETRTARDDLPFMGKKKGKKHASNGQVLEAEVKRLRKENNTLRKRLKKIADLAGDVDLEATDESLGGADSTAGDEELDGVSSSEEASPVPAS